MPHIWLCTLKARFEFRGYCYMDYYEFWNRTIIRNNNIIHQFFADIFDMVKEISEYHFIGIFEHVLMNFWKKIIKIGFEDLVFRKFEINFKIFVSDYHKRGSVIENVFDFSINENNYAILAWFSSGFSINFSYKSRRYGWRVYKLLLEYNLLFIDVCFTKCDHVIIVV